MHLIKRYANRKLYDPQTRQYVTLEELAAMIRAGEEVQVVDNASGEDITTQILTQIIVEQEKKQKGFLPHPVLRALVEAGGKPLGALRQRLETPLEFLRGVDDEIERRVQALIQRGDLAEEIGRQLCDQLLGHSPLRGSAAPPEAEQVAQILAARGTPTREDLQKLQSQIEQLSQKIGELS